MKEMWCQRAIHQAIRLAGSAIVMGCIVPTTHARTFYIAPDGNDGHAGTASAPFATLAKARDAVRTQVSKSGLASETIEVLIQPGRYALNDSVLFTENDSAPRGSRINYRAVKGGGVIFYGGASLSAADLLPLNPVDPRIGSIIAQDLLDQIRYVPLKEHGLVDYGKRSYHGFRVGSGGTPPMELFIDGKAMTPARWPNQGTAMVDEAIPDETRILEAGDDWKPEKPTGKGGVFKVDFDRLHYWQQAEDPWLDGLVANDWSWQSHEIASFDTENKTITLKNPAPYTVRRAPTFFVENLLEEIDRPGEYFIDRATGYLYLYPPADMTGASFISVSTLDKCMVVIDGASRLAFDGFTLSTGRAGAIDVVAGEANLFQNLEIQNVSGTAVRLAGRNNGVRHSVIHDVGGSGVVLEGGDSKSLMPGRNYVEDTAIHAFAQYDKAYTPGVKLRGVGNRISHCEIFDGPHGGITVGGNEHLVEYCNLHHLIRDFSDFGAIYAAIGQNPLQRGNIIRRNLISHLGAPGRKWCVGIYSDWFSQGFTIEENMLYRIGDDPEMFEFIGVVNSSGRYNRILNNVFVNCSIPYDRGYNMSYGYIKNGKDKKLLQQWRELLDDPLVLQGPYGTRYPELHRFFDEAIWFPTTSYFERNVIYNRDVSLNPEYIPEHFIMDRRAKGWGLHEDLANARDNWVTNGDPGFVDLSKTNLTFRADAPVFDEIPGFRFIPFDRIGIRPR